ncbi:hypothetical protein [Candidatus Magnetominusculus xianensis]|nr:hypothetical protein [Candidatus Magnetominusculus xianensis]MBF0403204.1 hypothetical protein [Nitrospirota bacterium]
MKDKDNRSALTKVTWQTAPGNPILNVRVILTPVQRYHYVIARLDSILA